MLRIFSKRHWSSLLQFTLRKSPVPSHRPLSGHSSYWTRNISRTWISPKQQKLHPVAAFVLFCFFPFLSNTSQSGKIHVTPPNKDIKELQDWLDREAKIRLNCLSMSSRVHRVVVAAAPRPSVRAAASVTATTNPYLICIETEDLFRICLSSPLSLSVTQSIFRSFSFFLFLIIKFSRICGLLKRSYMC